MLLSISISLQLVLMSFAHVQMMNPPPLRSKYDPKASSIDYSMTDPLQLDGSDFPCKRYQKDPITHTVATYAAGSSYTLQLAGSAVHGGGSCQISLSYDNGESFGVIHSIIGGCPLSLVYEFTIPSNAPASDQVLLAWTWFNQIGNREMYMNCARVKITGSGSGFTAPSIFKANIFGPGTCRTPENKDIVFPNPGNSVEYGDSPNSRSNGPSLTNCPSSNDSGTSLGSSSGSSPTGLGHSDSSTKSKPEAQPSRKSSSTSHSLSNPAKSSSIAPAASDMSTASSSNSCIEDSIKCISDVLWELCSNGKYIGMGHVAPRTTCSNGKLAKRNP